MRAILLAVMMAAMLLASVSQSHATDWVITDDPSTAQADWQIDAAEPIAAVGDWVISLSGVCPCGDGCECEKCECKEKQAAKPRNVPKLYTRADCIHCPAVKKYLKDNEVAYEEIEDSTGVVPRVEWDGDSVTGYRPERLNWLLGRPLVKESVVVLRDVSTYGPPQQACTTCRGR